MIRTKHTRNNIQIIAGLTSQFFSYNPQDGERDDPHERDDSNVIERGRD